MTSCDDCWFHWYISGDCHHPGAGNPPGGYLYRVFSGRKSIFDKVCAPVEGVLFRAVGVDPSVQMDWKSYLRALMLVNFTMMLFVYVILRIQGFLPLNPDHIKGMSWDLAFNTAASFITNTNWQNYAGEQSLSYLSQMSAITYLQFTSAATGFVAAIAFLRSLVAHRSGVIGNFWVDLIKIHDLCSCPQQLVG
ncbi:potassium-transporting ATPase subunit KdpA [Alicyclobacillus fastidiosus]|uniref:potassium-transporting ATPase subunit KdpA n=1 Tax=Alicyclobacillus fastidiosus TaxID=392011 RepID=UPI0024E0D0E9|nr:potassium-transporting ATPase subunit KdpA [Alicyclobacillus fastidiosus]